MLLGQAARRVVEVAIEHDARLALAHARLHVEALDVHLVGLGFGERALEAGNVVRVNGGRQVALGVLRKRRWMGGMNGVFEVGGMTQ